MIINVRGTSGSGKSTLIRQIIARYNERVPIKPDGVTYPRDEKDPTKERSRRQPWAYRLPSRNGGRDLGLIGHYETDCGGCDTLAPMDLIFDLVRACHAQDMHVLFEGLLISADFNRTHALHSDGLPLLVIGLNTPLDLCTRSIEERREGAYQRRLAKAQAEGKPAPQRKKPVNAANTESKFKGTQTTMQKLLDHGVAAEWHDRESGLERVIGALGA